MTIPRIKLPYHSDSPFHVSVLRAGAEEAPEEQRDEQRGASGPHGGALIE